MSQINKNLFIFFKSILSISFRDIKIQFRNMSYKIDKILINNKFINHSFDPSRLFKHIYTKLDNYQCSGEYFDFDEVLFLLNKYKNKYKYVYPGVLVQIKIYVCSCLSLVEIPFLLFEFVIII